MIYAVFLCMTFVGHPDMDRCSPVGNGPFGTVEECRSEIERLRAGKWLPPAQRGNFERHGINQAGYAFETGLSCKEHQTWTDVD